MARSPLVLALLLLLIGCPEPDDPGPAVLADDDSSVDDDDSLADDDDDDALQRSGVVWLQERQDRTSGQAPQDRVFAFASFAEPPPAAMRQFRDHADLGLPLPGLLLHPDLAPNPKDEEGCAAIAHNQDWAALPDSVDVGDRVHLVSPGGAELDLASEQEFYGLETAGPLTASSWSLELDGAADWPASVASGLIELPAAVELIGPSPGNLGGLTAVPVTWIAGGEPAVEITLIRYDSPADTSHWEGVRCLVLDDGEFHINAVDLAGPGTGPVHFSIARARWSVDPGDADAGRPALHDGAITGVSFEMTISGR